MKKEIKLCFEKRYLELFPDKDANDYQYYKVMRMLDEALHDGLVINASSEQSRNPLLDLMHDTAHDLDKLRHANTKLKEYLKEKKLEDSLPYVCAEYISSSHLGIRDKLDEFYIKEKQK